MQQETRLIVRQSGNVEIGTEAPHPGNQLIVDGPFPAIKFGDGNGKVGGLHAGTNRVILSTDDGKERLVINQASGNVGIGTSSPSQLLNLEGPNSPRVIVTDTTNTVTTEIGAQDIHGFVGTLSGHDLRILTSNDEKMRITTSGNVGIGTITPADKLDVFGGDIRVGSGGIGCVKDSGGTAIAGTCVSDMRLKKNIVPASDLLQKVTQLQPVYFQWKSDEYPEFHFGTETEIALVAQDVEKIMPELVTVRDDGYKAIHYEKLSFLMLQAIKELKEQNDELKQLICLDNSEAELCEQSNTTLEPPKEIGRRY